MEVLSGRKSLSRIETHEIISYRYKRFIFGRDEMSNGVSLRGTEWEKILK